MGLRRLTSALALLFLLPALPAIAARLGGAYYVDDAGIGKVGSCEIESWGSFAASGDRIKVFSAACVGKRCPSVAFGTNLSNLRSAQNARYTPALTHQTCPTRIGAYGTGGQLAST